MKYSTIKTMFINCEHNKESVTQLLNNRISLLQYITDTKSDYNYEVSWLSEFTVGNDNYKISVETIRNYNIEITDLISFYNNLYNDNIKTELIII